MLTQQQDILCCITKEPLCPVTQAEKALQGGAAMIQLRHKSASGADLFYWATHIQRLCNANNALCILNDRLDIALAAGTDGVHLGQSDIPARAARKLLGQDRILGITVSSLAEAEKAVDDGADYLGLGHIYKTGSKKKTGAPIGLQAIRNVTEKIAIPVLAIGGIHHENICDVIQAGAAGAAVIAAVADAPDPAMATFSLIKKMQSCHQ